jgi:hypothetical protein
VFSSGASLAFLHSKIKDPSTKGEVGAAGL